MGSHTDTTTEIQSFSFQGVRTEGGRKERFIVPEMVRFYFDVSYERQKDSQTMYRRMEEEIFLLVFFMYSGECFTNVLVLFCFLYFFPPNMY